MHGTADDPAWSEREALLVRLVDELHDTGTVSAELWDELAAQWNVAQLVELVATVGFYHFVSFTANALGVEPEEYGERFPGLSTGYGCTQCVASCWASSSSSSF